MTIGSAIYVLDSAFADHAKVNLDIIFSAVNRLECDEEVWSSLTELQRKAIKIIPEMLRDYFKWGVSDAYGYASDILCSLKIDLKNHGLI